MGLCLCYAAIIHNTYVKATYESIKKDRALADGAQFQSDDE